jgi:hypothetical protein
MIVKNDTFRRLTLINRYYVIKELKDHDLSVFDRVIIMHCYMPIMIYKLMHIN